MMDYAFVYFPFGETYISGCRKWIFHLKLNSIQSSGVRACFGIFLPTIWYPSITGNTNAIVSISACFYFLVRKRNFSNGMINLDFVCCMVCCARLRNNPHGRQMHTPSLFRRLWNGNGNWWIKYHVLAWRTMFKAIFIRLSVPSRQNKFWLL